MSFVVCMVWSCFVQLTRGASFLEVFSEKSFTGVSLNHCVTVLVLSFGKMCVCVCVCLCVCLCVSLCASVYVCVCLSV